MFVSAAVRFPLRKIDFSSISKTPLNPLRHFVLMILLRERPLKGRLMLRETNQKSAFPRPLSFEYSLAVPSYLKNTPYCVAFLCSPPAAIPFSRRLLKSFFSSNWPLRPSRHGLAQRAFALTLNYQSLMTLSFRGCLRSLHLGLWFSSLLTGCPACFFQFHQAPFPFLTEPY